LTARISQENLIDEGALEAAPDTARAPSKRNNPETSRAETGKSGEFVLSLFMTIRPAMRPICACLAPCSAGRSALGMPSVLAHAGLALLQFTRRLHMPTRRPDPFGGAQDLLSGRAVTLFTKET
jgi:hypothetical protein